MIQQTKKALLIRFSSFGDVTQALSIPTRLSELSLPVHWLTRQDMAPLIEGHPFVEKIWAFDRKLGLMGLFRLALRLRQEEYSHIYDAHNNLRSRLVCLLLQPPFALGRVYNPPFVIRKPAYRWKRFLLFQFRINRFRQPFSGQRDLLVPLRKWGLSEELPPPPQLYLDQKAQGEIKKRLKEKNIDSFITLAPSASYILKRWPIQHWKKLIELNPQIHFVILGGKEDTFVKQLELSNKVHNWVGTTNFKETAAVIAQTKILVANDTGLLHVAEQLGRPCIALMGPAPFGFPSRPSTKIMQISLPCRPCSKHGQKPCRNKIYQQCLVEITPEQVSQQLGSI